MQRFRGGLVVEAHRLCVSLNSRLKNNKEEEEEEEERGGGAPFLPLLSPFAHRKPEIPLLSTNSKPRPSPQTRNPAAEPLNLNLEPHGRGHDELTAKGRVSLSPFAPCSSPQSLSPAVNPDSLCFSTAVQKLPTETKVESGTSHSKKSGTSLNLSNSGKRPQGAR